MKNLVLGSMMAVMVSQAAGCIITTSNDEYAVVNATWDLKSNAGTSIPCPPGTTTAAVYAQEVDTSYRLIGTPFIDLYNCDDGVGVSDPLPPSVYQVWVELTGDSGNNVYASSTSRNEAAATERFPDGYFLNVLDADLPFKTTLYSDAGYFQFDWDLRDTATNAPLDCTTGAVPKVGLVSTFSGTSMAFDDQFQCGEHYGLSGNLLQGTYRVDVQAINTATPAQGLGPMTTIPSASIAGPNKVTELGSIMVKVD